MAERKGREEEESRKHRRGEWTSVGIADGVATASQPGRCSQPGRGLDADRGRSGHECQ